MDNSRDEMLRRCVTSAKCFKSVGAPRGAVQLLYDSAERRYDSTTAVICDGLEHCQNISLRFDRTIMEIARRQLSRRLERIAIAIGPWRSEFGFWRLENLSKFAGARSSIAKAALQFPAWARYRERTEKVDGERGSVGRSVSRQKDLDEG